MLFSGTNKVDIVAHMGWKHIVTSWNKYQIFLWSFFLEELWNKRCTCWNKSRDMLWAWHMHGFDSP